MNVHINYVYAFCTSTQ